MIKNTNPRKLALITSLIVPLSFSPACIIIFRMGYNEVMWKTLLFCNVALFGITFFLFRYILEQFIYDRIRLIYKTIHDLKAPKDLKKQKFSGSTDIIRETNHEVLAWASDKKKEVEELKKQEAYRREFLGNVSHELKTPIFNIQGYVLTLLDGGMDDPEINRQYLLRTEQSVDRIIGIVEDLEAIARLESGELKLNLISIDIVALAREVMEFMEIKAASRQIQLKFDRNYDSPIYVQADRQGLQQVLTNLMVNSIKYGNENGNTRISFFDMDKHILVEVTDNGIGIAREELPRIFERFYRGDKSRSFREGGASTGLGLAIVKHIIEAHNQTINVRSTPGVGTTFAFTLNKGKGPTLYRRNIGMF